jgi:hypothetical protein
MKVSAPPRVRFTTVALVAALLASLQFASGPSQRAVSAPVPPTKASAALALPPAPTIPAKIDCATLVQSGARPNALVPNFEEIAEAPTRITSASVVAATGTEPEHCLVQGYVMPQIKFRLKLPTTTWQGRYLQVGCGGFCGSVGNPAFPACRTELGGDFAVAATNDGHDAGIVDAMFAGYDEQDRIDYAYRAVHVVSVAAKEIQKAYYGQGPNHSYWTGCSTGGREGLMEAQRFPDDFDGIVAGAPANLQTFNPIYMKWAIDANTGADGGPILTAEKVPALRAAVTAACDDNDGVVGDGLIGDPRDCHFDPIEIQCAGADSPSCLTPAQVKVVRTFYNGVLDEKGNRLDPRIIPRGSERTWVGFWVPTPPPASAPAGTPPNYGAYNWGHNPARWFSYPIGEGRPLDDVEVSMRDFRLVAKQADEYYEALNPNLHRFRAAGGKLMIYHGLSDESTTPSQTWTYYDAVRKEMGGQRATDEFARLFMIPGMGHCGGGPSPSTSNMLLQVVNWVEEGTAPESIVVSDRNPTTDNPRQRPVFAYPRVAKYVGPDPAEDPSGPDRVENFVAAKPTTKHQDHVEWAGDFLLKPEGPRR